MGVRPNSQQAGVKQWAFILGKEPLHCVPLTEAPSRPGLVWAEGTVGGRGHWLAGQRVVLAGEVPQEVCTVNTTHNASLSFTPSPISQPPLVLGCFFFLTFILVSNLFRCSFLHATVSFSLSLSQPLSFYTLCSWPVPVSYLSLTCSCSLSSLFPCLCSLQILILSLFLCLRLPMLPMPLCSRLSSPACLCLCSRGSGCSCLSVCLSSLSSAFHPLLSLWTCGCEGPSSVAMLSRSQNSFSLHLSGKPQRPLGPA